jgi:hypothetical protein
MKFNKTSVFLTLFGLFLLACLAFSVKSKFHEAMTCVETEEKASNLARMPEEGGVFDPDAHVDAKYRDRPKKASLSFMDPLERLKPEGMQNKYTLNKQLIKGDRSGGKFGFCPGEGAPMKDDKDGTNCHGFCPDNASIYKTDAKGTNCYGFCVANDKKSPYKKDAAGSNCFGFCPNDKTLYKRDEEGSNCFGKCDNNPDVWKQDAAGSNCFGKCDNNPDVWKVDAAGSNCAYMCSTELGAAPSLLQCCSDGSMREDAAGSNCPPKMENQSLELGLCPDGKTFKPRNGLRCPDPETFGLCADGVTYKTDSVGSNCSKYPADLPQSCKTSPYGCCPDMKTPRNKTGSNCFEATDASTAAASVENGDMYPGLMPYNTTTVFIPPPAGVPSEEKKCKPKPAPKACATAAVEPECPAVPKGWAVPGAGDKTTLEPVQVTCPAPPPCPACARCPEPAFECKKVPNYNRADKDNLPQAVLPNYSSFGM